MDTPIEQTRLDEKNNYKKDILVAFCLLFFTLIFRLPSFFPAVINWDESTYILMGQSILDGHLPYIDFWEIKPPIAFLSYALAIALLGKSIVSVRIAGALCVAVVAFFTYLVGKSLWNLRTGILAATMFVMMSTLLGSGQATMTEHIALVPLVGAFLLLVTQKTTPRILFFAGILMMTASMIRLNLAYVTTIVGFFALFANPLRSRGYVLKRGFAYAAGSCLVILLVYLPYALTGNQKIFWLSVILAPLSYTKSQLSVLEIFRQQISYIWRTISRNEGRSGVSILVWIGGLAGLTSLALPWRNTPKLKQRGFILLAIFLCGIEISLLKGGAAYSHYLIQLTPFLSLAAAAFLNALLNSPIRWLITCAIVLALVTSTPRIIAGYQIIISRFLEQKPLSYGPAYEIAAYLIQENSSREPVYIMNDHIVYWLMDTPPMSKLVHPSLFTDDYLLKYIDGAEISPEREMAKILAQKPKFIVKTKELLYLSDKTVAHHLLTETLQTQYQLVKEIEGRQIYRRISD